MLEFQAASKAVGCRQVILAGYRRPMEKLIATNPGFQSRIAHQFQFDDYTCPQLLEISEKFMAAKRHGRPRCVDAVCINVVWEHSMFLAR